MTCVLVTEGEPIELSVCSDCVQYIVNAELPSDSHNNELMKSILDGERSITDQGAYLLSRGEEIGFSIDSCDL